MFLLPDKPATTLRRLARISFLTALAMVLAACSSAPIAPRRELPDTTSKTPDLVVDPSSAPALVLDPSKPPIAHFPCEAPPADTVTAMLGYADRVHLMSPAELGQEITRLATSVSPAEQVQLSLALSQLHQLPELVRAQELLGRVLANAGAQAQPLQPLSRLLSSRYGEQRRLSDLLDQQTQQTREVQRKLDQTNERLEALKAIERSLTSRPPPANATPQATQGQRPNAP
jgi:hypothetical protein